MHETAPEGELPPVHDKHNLASASPVTDGERVYAWFGTGQLVALDVERQAGLVEASRQGVRFVRHQLGPRQLAGAVPGLDHPALLSHAALVHAGARQAHRRGEVEDRQAGRRGVVQLADRRAGPGGNELIVNSSTGVESFDPATGESLWTYPEVNRFPIPVAMVDNGMLYLSRGYRSSPYMAIKLGGRGDITNTHVAWRVATGGPYVSSLVHYQGVIYMSTDNGILSAVDASNGQRLWQERVDGIFSASPIAGDGKVYFVSEGARRSS